MKPASTHVRQGAVTRTTSRALALLLVLALSLTGITLGASSASADVPGLTTSVNFGGTSYNGTPVLNEGAEGTLTIQYSRDNGLLGNTYDVELPAGVSLGDFAGGNTAVTLTQTGNVLHVTFASSWGSVNQGVVSVKFKYTDVEKSEKVSFTYKVGGDPISKDLIVLNGGDELENVSNQVSKAVSGNLNSYVSVVDGQVKVNADIIGKPLTYTLNVNTAAANSAYPITDQLPAGMAFGATFTLKQSTWDSDGLNKKTTTTQVTPAISGTAAAGQNATLTLDLPGPSQNEISYTASIANPAALVTLQNDLQAAYDALPGEDRRDFSVPLTNTATLNGTGKSATVTVGGTRTGTSKPNWGSGFDKQPEWSTKNIEDGNGATTLPVGLTWTFKADLRSFDGATNDYYKLNRNVVLSDTLDAHASWNTDDPDFITTTNLGTSSLNLTKLSATCPTNVTDMASTPAGSWCIDGRTLYVNVGQDKTTNATIKVKTQINSVQGLPSASTSVVGGEAHRFDNVLKINFSTVGGGVENGQNSRNVTLVDRGVGTDGAYDDPQVFTKTAPGAVNVDPTTKRATVKYTFNVSAAKGVNAADASIIDQVDTSVFDLSDLASIKATLTGTYDTKALTAADFTLELDSDENLVIALSAAGKSKAVTANKQWTVNLSLTTKPVTGKQTISVDNHAGLTANGEDVVYFSEISTEATSYGDEAEVQKYVRNSNTSAWTQSLRAELDGDGQLNTSVYVYKIEFIAHNNYYGIPMVPVVDTLPDGVDFVGFVDEADADTAADSSTQPTDLGNNITATWDGDRTITMSSAANLAKGTRVSVYFAVQLASAEADVPIVNTVSESSATITPTDGYPIAVRKVDSSDPTKAITDTDARFDLLDADGVVVKEIFVQDNQLRVLEDNVVKGVKVSKPGTYTLREVNPPTGYVKSDETLTIVVKTGEAPEPETFYNDPVGPSVTVGDYVWVDKNRDGLQDATDIPLKGVVLTITGPGGWPVVGVNGLVVGPQTTGTDGQYLFTGLPTLVDGQKYTVTIDQTATGSVLNSYLPTDQGANGGSGDKDSSTWTTSTVEPLTADGSEDLSLDFGFVKQSVSVGNYLWIDVNRDGLQDSTDIAIEGVKLEVYGPDGIKITEDIFGDTFDVRTDADGHYLFDNLPVLEGRESYTVKIVQDDPDTVTALKGLPPTQAGAGSDRGEDSSTDEATSSADLSTDQASDLTLDFGFQRARVSVGDYVWIDVNHDGLQDGSDTPIAGVVLKITGPDGSPVVTVDGEPVANQTTDAKGKYLFSDLPPLLAGQSYTVSIVKDDPSTVAALKGMTSTKAGSGSDKGKDSSTDEATSSADLSIDGAADLSLDFGFWSADLQDDETPTTPDESNGSDEPDDSDSGVSDGSDDSGNGVASDDEQNGALPDTGAEVTMWTLLAGLGLVLAGAVTLALRRRVS